MVLRIRACGAVNYRKTYNHNAFMNRQGVQGGKAHRSAEIYLWSGMATLVEEGLGDHKHRNLIFRVGLLGPDLRVY